MGQSVYSVEECAPLLEGHVEIVNVVVSTDGSRDRCCSRRQLKTDFNWELNVQCIAIAVACLFQVSKVRF